MPPLTCNQPLRHTILLVEDEPFVREATCNLLESAGFCILPAADAHDALRIYDAWSRPIDLVMTDMVLPGCTGQELAADLLKRCPHLKILLTSGYETAEYATEDPTTSVYFLPKPYSRRCLIEKVALILGMPMLVPAQSQAS